MHRSGECAGPARVCELLLRAVHLGVPEAAYDLSEIYDIGILAPRDAVEARRLQVHAASSGHAAALARLRRMKTQEGGQPWPPRPPPPWR